MLSEQDIELAHPDAFNFVFGTLGAAKSVWFNSHLDGCRHCQKVVAEYSDIGQIIQNLPPHVEPPADLEDRTVAAMAAAQAAGGPSPIAAPITTPGSFPPCPGPIAAPVTRTRPSPGSTRSPSPSPASG